MTRDALTFIRQHFQWIDLFDHLTFSCHLGQVKPGREIYQACLDALAVPAGECLFVDDSLTNVKGARAVGMSTIHFQSYDQFVQELVQTGLLDNRSP